MPGIRSWRSLCVALCMIVAGPSPVWAQAEPLRLLAAGSLTQAMGEVAAAFAGTPGGQQVATGFGPSGLLRERIERGEARADVFFSASLEHATRLEQAGRAVAPAVVFVRNRLCLLVRPGLTVTPSAVLDTLLDPVVRLGTSTPRADPSGDYAWALFARAEAVRPGSRAMLEGKALQLVGGPSSATPPAGIGAVGWHFREGRADVFLGYCTSGAQAAREVPGITVQDLPPSLAVGADYGMALLSARPEAVRLALFALSPAGQTILARHGFAPVTQIADTP
ncbi:molybdate ABC transporter substrate-binding protein [Humitalea sp. 24SJ18S-53]|uniref:molybdate ABC transporter substrate-binding protein n=1 Tax=Humitalea sp. 24SJ18S-53 TaxID=3422307 RepID=UPI003D66C82D